MNLAKDPALQTKFSAELNSKLAGGDDDEATIIKDVVKTVYDVDLTSGNIVEIGSTFDTNIDGITVVTDPNTTNKVEQIVQAHTIGHLVSPIDYYKRVTKDKHIFYFYYKIILETKDLIEEILTEYSHCLVNQELYDPVPYFKRLVNTHKFARLVLMKDPTDPTFFNDVYEITKKMDGNPSTAVEHIEYVNRYTMKGKAHVLDDSILTAIYSFLKNRSATYEEKIATEETEVTGVTGVTGDTEETEEKGEIAETGDTVDYKISTNIFSVNDKSINDAITYETVNPLYLLKHYNGLDNDINRTNFVKYLYNLNINITNIADTNNYMPEIYNKYIYKYLTEILRIGSDASLLGFTLLNKPSIHESIFVKTYNEQKTLFAAYTPIDYQYTFQPTHATPIILNKLLGDFKVFTSMDPELWGYIGKNIINVLLILAHSAQTPISDIMDSLIDYYNTQCLFHIKDNSSGGLPMTRDLVKIYTDDDETHKIYTDMRSFCELSHPVPFLPSTERGQLIYYSFDAMKTIFLNINGFKKDMVIDFGSLIDITKLFNGLNNELNNETTFKTMSDYLKGDNLEIKELIYRNPQTMKDYLNMRLQVSCKSVEQTDGSVLST